MHAKLVTYNSQTLASTLGSGLRTIKGVYTMNHYIDAILFYNNTSHCH